MPLQYFSLKAHIKGKVGPNKTYDAIPKLRLPQKQHSHNTISSLMEFTKQGSGNYRKKAGAGAVPSSGLVDSWVKL